MTRTLTQIQPRCVTSSHPALSTMERAASQPAARVWGLVATTGSHCHTVYASSPR